MKKKFLLIFTILSALLILSCSNEDITGAGEELDLPDMEELGEPNYDKEQDEPNVEKPDIPESDDFLEEVQAYLEAGGDLDGDYTPNADYFTYLSYASYYNYLASANLLLEKGADVNGFNNNGYTALMYSSIFGYDTIAFVLWSRCGSYSKIG